MILKDWLRGQKVGLLVILLVAGMAAGCSSAGGESEGADAAKGKDKKGAKAESDAEKEDDRVPVEVVDIERGRIEEILRFSTNLEAESQVEVYSQAARLVTGLLVEEGDDVRKGQVLVRLQDDQQRTQVSRVEGQLAKARREYDRQKSLFAQQLISEQIFNEATYDLEQLELALADAEREMGYTSVRAPISGTVTQRLVNLGDQITVNQHLFDIVDFDSIVARIYVPEKSLPRLARGQTANLFAGAFGKEPRRGVVERIAPLVDSKSGTVKVTVAIPRGEELLPGMYVSVELITAVHENAILVPKRALVYDDEQIYVFRVVELPPEEKPADAAGDGEAASAEKEATEKEAAEKGPVLGVERLLLSVLLEDRDNVEPVDLIAPGDRIVAAGQAGLKDGAKIRLVKGEAAVETPAEDGAEG
jgi:membrane fusion protein, multidrug efflux system